MKRPQAILAFLFVFILCQPVFAGALAESATKLRSPSLTLTGHSVGVRSLAFSPNGRELVTGAQDETVHVWDISSGNKLHVLRPGAPVNAVDYSPDGSLVAAALGDGTVRVWSVGAGTQLHVLRGHEDIPSSVEFSPDGTYILSGSDDNTARIWQTGSGTEVRVLRGHESSVPSAEYDPSGRRVVTASFDGTARVWQASTGKELVRIKGARRTDGGSRLIELMMGAGSASAIVSASFSPDGSMVITAESDGAARLWESATGRNVGMFKSGRRPLADAQFSADGSMVVTLSASGALQAWDVNQPRNSRPLLDGSREADRAAAFALSPDGEEIATGHVDGTVHIWRVSN